MAYLCDCSEDSVLGFHLPSEPIGQRVFRFMALIRDSSAVERLLVKQRDVSSNLTLGAKPLRVIPGSFNCEDRTP
jgi:hypothetical protein